MTTTTETPSAGPWTAHDDDGTGTLPCVLAAQVTGYGNFYVAQCNNYADARLIAAAPAMIAALRELIAEADNGFHNPNTGGFALARQAVALNEHIKHGSYDVKCDDCKTTIRQTADVRESYQGGRCDSCRGMTARAAL